MRRPIAAVAVAVLILAAVTLAGFGIAACGSSPDSAATTTQAAAGAAGGQAPDMSALFTTALDPLVEDGTMTSEQESSVIDALASSTPSGGAGQGGQMPSPGATPPSGQAPSDGATPPGGSQGTMPGPSQLFSTALEPLVSDGTITAAQEAAITEALGLAMQQGGPSGQQSTTQTGTTSSTSTLGSTQTY